MTEPENKPRGKPAEQFIIDEASDLIAADFSEAEIRCLSQTLDRFPRLDPDQLLKLAAIAEHHDLSTLMTHTMEEMGELLQAFGKHQRNKPKSLEQMAEESVDTFLNLVMLMHKLSGSTDLADLIGVQLSYKVDRTFQANFA